MMGNYAFPWGPLLWAGTQCSGSILCQPAGPHIRRRQTVTVCRAPCLSGPWNSVGTCPTHTQTTVNTAGAKMVASGIPAQMVR